MSVKYFGAVDPQKFDGHASVKYFGGVDHPDNRRMGMRLIFDGHASVKYFGDVDPPNI